MPDLEDAVRKGRAQFLRQFPGIATDEVQACLADPAARETFERSKLDLGERARHAEAYGLTQELLRLRRDDGVFGSRARRHVDGAVLGDQTFVLRFFGEAGDDRLLLVNLGRDLILSAAPEPLVAPPHRRAWHLVFSTEDARYGGCGVGPIESDEGWRIPGQAAVALAAVPRAA